MPNYTHIPGELTDRILDFLHDDQRSLSFCTLVSRSWLCSSRYHLFSRITVRHIGDGHNVFERFLRFLNRSPHIAFCIRRIIFVGTPQSFPHEDIHREGHIDALLLYRTIQCLQSVQSVELDGLIVNEADSQKLPSSHFRLRQYTLSRISHGTGDFLSTVHQFLQGFSAIFELKINEFSNVAKVGNVIRDRTSYSTEALRHLPCSPSVLQVRTLEFNCSLSGHIVSGILLQHLRPESLHALNACIQSEREIEPLSIIIRSVAPNLHTFRLFPDPSSRSLSLVAGEHWKKISLSQCASLKTIVFTVHQGYRDGGLIAASFYLKRALQILRTQTPRSITEIIFEFNDGSYNFEILAVDLQRYLNWNHLDDHLASSQSYPHLKRVVFSFRNLHRVLHVRIFSLPVVYEEDVKKIEKKYFMGALPRLNSRGLLHVKHRDCSFRTVFRNS
ncbi:hypothetical protein C8Q75DRAFT_388155 [Abortiporus biennis]|nr:hypothetical protein C8Q75DRAFT_388155 [Abortiporus biennis]